MPITQIEYLEIEENPQYEEIIQKVISKCFQEEGLTKTKLYISITLTTPDNIRKINKQYRNIDKATDVLSFPMFEQEEINKMIEEEYNLQDVLRRYCYFNTKSRGTSKRV